MFERGGSLRALDVRSMADLLASVASDLPDHELIDQIAALEALKRAASAAQVRVTAAFAGSQRAAAEAAGVSRERSSRGIGEQVALARGESPHRGWRHLGMAMALVTEMPHTLAALTRGAIDEWAATVLVRESAVLSRPDRGELDTRISALLATPGVGVGRLERAARGVACALDPVGMARRASRAASDRRVSLRPAPDTMTYLTALLPVVDGVAVYAALHAAAATSRVAANATDASDDAGDSRSRDSRSGDSRSGDSRGRGQVMADTLVALVTGRDPSTQPVPVTVQLVMTDTALLEGGPTSATIGADGLTHQPVPAPIARALVAAAAGEDAAWVRRLFTAPGTGALVAMESRQRIFPAGLRHFIVARDQSCATPWCDAPIRHIDHIQAHAAGGATTAENGQGLCERCNHVKQTPGWATTGDAGRTTVTTPTGHTYPGTAPSGVAPAGVAPPPVAPPPVAPPPVAPPPVAPPGIAPAGVAPPPVAPARDWPAGVAPTPGGHPPGDPPGGPAAGEPGPAETVFQRHIEKHWAA